MFSIPRSRRATILAVFDKWTGRCKTSTYKNSSIGLWKGWLKILVKLKVKIKALLML
jgi:hypothetical protein